LSLLSPLFFIIQTLLLHRKKNGCIPEQGYLKENEIQIKTIKCEDEVKKSPKG